jgi:hypothetical protein
MQIRPETMSELDFADDEETIIRVRDEELNAPTPAPAPSLIVAADDADLPALPFALSRQKSPADEAWLAELDPSTRIILERAMIVAPSWPTAPRIRGAVAVPAHTPIPSLAASP